MPEQVKVNLSAADRREIRVFISSTFRDMQEEREELVKQIFPQLRRLCESRGVTWGEVDLRWGVPDEAKAEGKVLPLCLQEIEHCWPYFIGILGERYGWVPEEIPESLFESQSWLREHLHQSVTALEIFHGVLRNPEMDKHAFFYFRDPSYAATRPGFTEEDPALRERLAKLKDEIRRSGFPAKEPFASPKQLGEWVLRDLTAVIEELYPEKDVPDALDRAALDHEAYSASRCTVYISRQKYMDRLDAHAAGDGLPLVVVGESGGGKSALLANWTHDWGEQHLETPVLVHFIGAAPDSANSMAMLRRLLGEFQRRFEIQIEIPDQPDALRMTFANALHMVAARGRLVLALDAFNQIEDRDGAPDLVWLPPIIPPNVRLVVSTLPGRSWDDLKKRDWPVMTVEPLTVAERKELIVKYLKRYSKELSPEPAHRIATASQTGNGLYLSTLLNELRQFGTHERLDQRIDWYLQAASPVELYRKVIERWEQDYEEEGSGSEDIVGESLSRLWAARRGLSEVELLDSLGTTGSPLPRAVWSPLFLAAEDALVSRSGLLTFAHDYLREAVRDAYLPTEAHRQIAHRTLAEYFAVQPQGPRQLDELPWQCQESSDWAQLVYLLQQTSLFDALWERDAFEVKAYWARIETQSPWRMELAYTPVAREPARDPDHAWRVGQLLGSTGNLNAAVHICAKLISYYRERGDNTHLLGALNNLGTLLQRRGMLSDAIGMYKDSAGLCIMLGDLHGLALSLSNQASIMLAQGDFHGALDLGKKAAELFVASGDRRGAHEPLGNQASILRKAGDLAGAMAIYKEEELKSKEMGDLDRLSHSLCGQGLVLNARGDWDAAIALFKEAARICRVLGNTDGLSEALGNQATILQSQGDLDAAMAMCKEVEILCLSLGKKDGLRTSLGHQATILYARGDLDGAMALHKQEEDLCRELEDKHSLALSLGNQANILYSRRDPDGAMARYKEVERICRELGDDDGLGAVLGNQANILFEQGDGAGGAALLKQSELLFRKIGIPEMVCLALLNQARMLSSLRERKQEARQLAAEALDLATKHGYQQFIGLAKSMLFSLWSTS